MILVTLGTQDKPFTRLLDAVLREIENGNIQDEVVVQAGCTKYETDKMQIFDLIPMEEFDKLMKQCDLLITHGGVGSIITGLKCNKKVIAVNFEADPIGIDSDVMDITMKILDIMGNKISEKSFEQSDLILTVPTDRAGLFDIEKLDKCYKFGYETVMKNIDKIREL